MKIRSLEDLEEIAHRGIQKIKGEKIRIAVGLGTCGIATGADYVYTYFENAIKDLTERVFLTKVGCFGYCSEEPLVKVTIPGKPLTILSKVNPEETEEILRAVLSGEIPDKKALCKIEEWNHITEYMVYGKGLANIPSYSDLPFFRGQLKLVLRNAGLINPEDLEEYIAIGGYKSLHKALNMKPEEVIEEVKRAGLRGRGGAGFPTGLKWEITAKNESDEKYVICNADEGDPGAYMNRNELESDPHAVIEGMIIGGYAIGAKEGIIYIRAEYPLAIKRIETAIKQAREYGLLGENIFGSNFSFDIKIVKGAGAFVCGEETAMIASIEGKTGRPRPRPPFPAEKGLWGKPTSINNVETWCNIPIILAMGGERFSKVGKENNAGTKVFSLVGEVKRIGLVEVPLGTKLKTIVHDIGGGSPSGLKVKAVQIGGPSGGCIPEEGFDTPIDYESLRDLGTIMGSGGMVVMSEKTSMVETALFFIGFTSEESCGKCTPCREGLKQMLHILHKILSRRGSEEDLKLLEELSMTIQTTSLCGLGKTAPNPVLTTLRYFREEYEGLINDGKD
ncbi:MAG: NADH-quinone oxidoreductase subunit J/K [Synergistetes bacterium]|nr:MAG: NADH dehydrogenase (Quinone) [bacterium 42_11]MBC7331573.1 NADH-quinone oxidoreductase subunit J/K [Synergistota bacterium]MDK2871861.1 NADH-quinone oxidoreductase subunit [bacterium]